MNMKKKLSSRLIFVLLLWTIFSACNNADHSKSLGGHKQHGEIIYTCPMHPEIEINKPGKCPKCHMKLEVKADDLSDQVISPGKQVLSRQATIKLMAQNEQQVLKAQGYIDVDRNRSETVAARFGGRIEQLYVKYNLQFVKKGDRILELYSPELNTTQEEHLFLLKTVGEKTLLEQSRKKLKLLGITAEQVNQLEKTGTLIQTITVYSPTEGYVFFDKETNNSAESDDGQQPSMSNMNIAAKDKSDKYPGSSSGYIREGMYISKGEPLFSINDLENVWAIVSVPSEYHQVLSENNQVKVSSEFLPDEPQIGKISLMEPIYEENKQRFTRLRIVLPNPNGKLKLNSLVTAEITPEITRDLQIPASAVYRTGLNSFVWVKTGETPNGTGIFLLRKVTTGPAISGMVTVVKGLTSYDEVAKQAGYLTDSETLLNEN